MNGDSQEEDVILCKHCGEEIVEYREGLWTHENKNGGVREPFCQMTAAQPLEES